MEFLVILTIRVISVYQLLVIVRCFFSWFQIYPNNPITIFIYEITDPPMDALRRSLPFLSGGGMDFSPIVLLFGLQVVQNIIRGLL
jgi:YggT family protein